MDGNYSLTSVVFSGNAPAENTEVYYVSPNATNYVTNPTATGWGTTWNGRPVVRLPLYGSGSNITGITPNQIGAVSNSPSGIAQAGGVTNVSINGQLFSVVNGVATGAVASGSSGGGDIYGASNNVFATSTPITVNTNAQIRWLSGAVTNWMLITSTNFQWTIQGTNYVFP